MFQCNQPQEFPTSQACHKDYLSPISTKRDRLTNPSTDNVNQAFSLGKVLPHSSGKHSKNCGSEMFSSEYNQPHSIYLSRLQSLLPIGESLLGNHGDEPLYFKLRISRSLSLRRKMTLHQCNEL